MPRLTVFLRVTLTSHSRFLFNIPLEMSSAQKFVQRGATPSSRREVAKSSRVAVPQTVLKKEPTRPWDTDSEAADTTFSLSGLTQSGEMQHDSDYDDEEDDAGVYQDQLHSPPNHEVPNEFQNMDARRPKSKARWDTSRGSQYASHDTYQTAPLPVQPRVLPIAQGHLSKFMQSQSTAPQFSQDPPLTQKRASPVRHIDDSDGDDDEPAAHPTRKNQKPLKKSHSLKPAGPQSVSRSESGSFSHQSDASDRQQSVPIGGQLPIQTKGAVSTPRLGHSEHHKQLDVQTKSFPNHSAHDGQEAALPSNYHGQIQPIKKLEMEKKLFAIPSVNVDQEVPQSPDYRAKVFEDEHQMNIKQSQSQQTLHGLSLQQTDTFDTTDASAAVDDVQTFDSQSHVPADLERAPQPKKKRGLDLDYSPDTLSTMKFSDLQSQPFDIDPNTTAVNPNADLAELDLPQKLAALLGKSEEARRAFFASLSTEEWEDCGEWFVTQFGQLVKKMNEARRERTRVAQGFEDQVAERHNDVEASAQELAKGLQEMKTGGLGVLKGRNLAEG
jgi:hypothetical protein